MKPARGKPGTTPGPVPMVTLTIAASMRFSAWMAAVQFLRENADGNFTAELRQILELSRARSDSIAMRQDVCRVASYYLHQWAGVDPLPTDPNPR